jgi:simple sugar transport system permease protein
MIEPELAAVFVGSSIRLAAPLLLAATGELVSERAGVLNMSVEGMMLQALSRGPWAPGPRARPPACPGGAVCAAHRLVQAFLSITLRANQIVTGIGINILVLGATTLGYRALFGSRSRAEIPGLDKWAPPGLADIPILGEHVFHQTGCSTGPCCWCAVAWSCATSRPGLHAAGAGTVAAQLRVEGHRIRYGAVLSPVSCRRWPVVFCRLVTSTPSPKA